MDELGKLSLLDEVETQSWFAMNSFEKLSDLARNPDTKQLKEVWLHLQSFLAHTGILGALIFKVGNENRTKPVTDFLKEVLKMDDESPIKEREGRNFLEHIEAFEIYAANHTGNKRILQMAFDNRAGLEYMTRENRWFVKRGLIIDEMVFVYQSQEARRTLDLIPIYKEIVRIFKSLDGARETVAKRVS